MQTDPPDLRPGGTLTGQMLIRLARAIPRMFLGSSTIRNRGAGSETILEAMPPAQRMGPPKPFIVQSVETAYLICRALLPNNVVDTVDVYVAKPPELQVPAPNQLVLPAYSTDPGSEIWAIYVGYTGLVVSPYNNTVIRWIDINLDARKYGPGSVKVYDVDDAPGYLDEKLKDSATFHGAADPLVKYVVTDEGNNVHKLRLFVDVSAIADYDPGKTQILEHESGTLHWQDTLDC